MAVAHAFAQPGQLRRVGHGDHQPAGRVDGVIQTDAVDSGADLGELVDSQADQAECQPAPLP